MKARYWVGMLLVVPLVTQVRADDKSKGTDFAVLTRADLKKLEGVWLMKVQSKTGWKGSIRATIKLYPDRADEKDFGNILYDYDLTRGQEKSSIRNAPLQGIAFAGVMRGKQMLLVTAEREGIGPTVPFKVEPKEELSALVALADGKLRLDVSKSRQHFCFPMTDFDLEWSRLEFTRVKKD
jgi:hypothetical protein